MTMNAYGIKKGNLLRFAASSRKTADTYEVIEDAGSGDTIDGYPASLFAGVPLTPAMMRRNGFQQRPNETAVQREDLIFLELPNGDEGASHYVINVEYADDSTELHTLRYVHELQNFYTDVLDRSIEVLL